MNGLLLALCVPWPVQVYVDNTTQIPQGSPWNDSWSENVDFADVDDDGDLDAVWADGGNVGNDRNRIWINQGGLQGGTIGWFVDETSARLPTVQDSSRDVDFVDLEHDGDPDLFVSNSSTVSNQGNRFLVNAGGVQGGTAGFFLDETATRWVDVGVNNGTTSFSSVAPSIVFTDGPFEGSFIEWSCDSVFADLDADGDMDLVNSSYGTQLGQTTVPSRIFLNDGSGYFEEFNPSGFQLSGTGLLGGNPALWCEGLHFQGTTETNGSEADITNDTLGVEVGDLDGDLDTDLLMGAIALGPARIFTNRLEETGSLGLRDETYAAFSEPPLAGTKYEQELGDLDDDGDLDIYGVNWWHQAGQNDAVMLNDGAGLFGAPTKVVNSQPSDDEATFLDFDADGDLDVFVCTFEADHHLYENLGAPEWTLQRVFELPAFLDMGLGTDAVDVDLDGDYDIFVATDDRNLFLENTSQAPDTSAPRISLVEQVPDCPGAAPIGVRAHVFDNSSWDVAQLNATWIEYTVDGGPVSTVPMAFAGGQVWRGELPSGLSGTIAYAVESTDEHGNTGVSITKSFHTPSVTNYCTAGTSAIGCQALLSASGTPSASAPSGFVVTASGVEGQIPGLFFFGTSGKTAVPWGTSSSYKCVQNPAKRGALIWSTGTPSACDGEFDYDLNAHWSEVPAHNPGPGAVVQAQLWYRDPLSTSNQKTAFSDALEFGVCPR